MHPVMAISPNPFFVIATSADISPKQLPQARMVKPRTAAGKDKMHPNTSRILITISLVNEIQEIA